MASLLDLLAPWLSAQTQTPDRVVSAQPQRGANLSIDQSMLKGMPQQSSYDQQLQDPSQWNLSGQASVPDYSRLTTPGNPGGPSYNANYGQTSYPGSTADGNPYGSLVPPGYRGLLMAGHMSGPQTSRSDQRQYGSMPQIGNPRDSSGLPPYPPSLLNSMKQQLQDPNLPPVTHQAVQEFLKRWAQPNTNPGPVKPEPPLAM